MNEDFIPFELAVKLKEKGFDGPCYGYYHCNGGNDSFELCGNGDRDFQNSKNQYRVAAPTIPQVLKWLRKKKIVVSILPAGYNKETGLSNYYYVIYDVAEYFWKKYEYPQSFETYEECELSSIEYVLDNLI
jgi:hypothetical protein